MKRLKVCFLLALTALVPLRGVAQEATIKLTDAHKRALTSAENDVLKLQLELTRLEQQYARTREALTAATARLNDTLNDTVLQYIQADERSEYELTPDLDLRKRTESNTPEGATPRE